MSNLEKDKADSQRLAIILPTYNEEECIASVVRAWFEVTSQMKADIIVVNDGSTDLTESILNSLKKEYVNLIVLHQRNGGHGSAILSGYRFGLREGYGKIFQTDSDGQIDPQQFHAIFNESSDSDVVLAVRHPRGDGLFRQSISLISSIIIFLSFKVWILDPNVPFRLFTRDALRRGLLRLPEQVFAPNLLLSAILYSDKARIRRVKVCSGRRLSGISSLSFSKLMRAGLQTTRDLWRVRTQRPPLVGHAHLDTLGCS